jgi:SAM-dependent methyltransferase
VPRFHLIFFVIFFSCYLTIRFINGAVENEKLITTLGSFDLVYSTFSLHHWKYPVQAFRNIKGVLKETGTLLIYDFQRSWFSWHLPLRQGMVESIHAAYTVDEIPTILSRAGIR